MSAAQPADAWALATGQQQPAAGGQLAMMDQILAAQTVSFVKMDCHASACSCMQTYICVSRPKCYDVRLTRSFSHQAVISSGNGVALLQHAGMDETTAQLVAASMQQNPLLAALQSAGQSGDERGSAPCCLCVASNI